MQPETKQQKRRSLDFFSPHEPIFNTSMTEDDQESDVHLFSTEEKKGALY